MYKLKESVTWENIKTVYNDTGKYVFEDDFERIEMPVVVFSGVSESFYDDLEIIYHKTTNELEIIKRFNYLPEKRLYSESYHATIGENKVIKSISEFNEKCALLFGFYLKEV